MSNKKSIQLYFNLDNKSDEKLYKYIMDESNKNINNTVSSTIKAIIYDYYSNNKETEEQ